MRVVGVVPAAGFATRMQPLEGSKEVYPLAGRPAMDHLVERMRAAPCDELRVVTRPDKADVAEHALALGATVVEGRPRTVAESLALGIAGLDADDVVLFGFPDTLWEPGDGFARLVGALDDADVALGVFACAEPERSDVVVLDGDRVVRIDVKPADPASRSIWGCLAARAGALAGVERQAEPGEFLSALAATGRVRAVDFGTEFVDIGTPVGLARALELVGEPA